MYYTDQCVPFLPQQDLESLEEEVKDSKNVYYKRQSLCTTLCGNVCPLITISDQPHSGKQLCPSTLLPSTSYIIIHRSNPPPPHIPYW